MRGARAVVGGRRRALDARTRDHRGWQSMMGCRRRATGNGEGARRRGGDGRRGGSSRGRLEGEQVGGGGRASGARRRGGEQLVGAASPALGIMGGVKQPL